MQPYEYNSCNVVPSIAATQHIKSNCTNQLQHIPPKIAVAQYTFSQQVTQRLLSGQQVSLPALAEALEVEAGADTMGMTCVAALAGAAGAPAAANLGVTAQHSTAQHSTAQHSTAQHSTAQHSTAQHSTASRDSSIFYGQQGADNVD